MTYKSNIDVNARGFVYAASGDDSWDGRTLETAKETIQAAIDSTQLLSPPPGATNPSTVDEAQGGVFLEDIELFDSVLFEGTQTTIITSGLIGVKGADSLSFRPQTIVNNTNNASAILCDGCTSFGCNFSALIVGGDNGLGFEITGSNENIFFTVSQIRLDGDGAKGIEVTGETSTPIDFNFNTVIFTDDNEVFFNFNPSTATSRADVSVSSVFKAMTLPTGATAFLIEAGIVKARAGSLEADIVVDVTDSIFTLSCNVVGGDTISRAGGSVIYDTVGFIQGDLETVGDGTLQVRSSIIIGNATNAGGMSIKCDSFVGEIVNTGTMYAQIDDYTGTLPENDGSINGIIGGVRYGDWREEVLLMGSDFTTQTPTGLDAPMQITFGAAQGSVSDPLMLSAAGVITANEADQYNVSFFMQYGRTGAGMFSKLFFRILVNGTQVGDSIEAKLDNSNSDVPIQLSTFVPMVEGDELTAELVRDSGGGDSGELVSETPVLAWNAAPSAIIRISR